MAKQSAKVQQARKDELTGLGYAPSTDGNIFSNGETLPMMTAGNIADFTVKEWKDQIAEITAQIEKERPAIEGEHIAQADTTAVTVIDAQKEIAKFDVNELVIADWKTKYAGVVVTGLEDKTNIALVKEGKKLIRSKRTEVEKRRVSLKAPYIAAGKAIEDAANKYKLLFAEIEDPIDKQITLIDEWEAAEEKRKEEEANRELNRRVEALKVAGMTFNGTLYCIGDVISMDIVTIKSLPGSDFIALEAKVAIEKKKIDDAAEAIRLQKQKDEEAAEEARLELKKQQDELAEKQRIMDEANEKMKLKIIQIREKQATGAGLIFTALVPGQNTAGYIFKNGFADVFITIAFLKDSDDDIYDAKIEELTNTIESAKQQQLQLDERNKELERVYNERCQYLVALGMIQGPQYFYFSKKDVKQQATVDFKDVKTTEPDAWRERFEGLRKDVETITQAQADFETNAATLKQQQQERENKQNIQYMERSSQLITLGLSLIGTMFKRCNEFGACAEISVEKVKAIDPDNWGRVLLEVEQDVKRVNQDTETKRAEALQAREALKPDLQKAREYLTAVLSVPLPEIANESIGGILLEVVNAIAAATNSATDKLLAQE